MLVIPACVHVRAGCVRILCTCSVYHCVRCNDFNLSEIGRRRTDRTDFSAGMYYIEVRY